MSEASVFGLHRVNAGLRTRSVDVIEKKSIAVRSGTNRLLAALALEDWRALEDQLEYYLLRPGRVLHEPGEALRHVYFPASGIVSLVNADEKGNSAELALVGCEGIIGLEALLGSASSANRAVVQAAGTAYRLRVPRAQAAFAAGNSLHALALRFAQLLMAQFAQTAVCNLRHSLEQQFCRRLLLCVDRLGGAELQMTHEVMAAMLGVRRQGVTEAARHLQERNIIAYSRGRTTVLDRRNLEARACECYAVLRRRAAELLPIGTAPAEPPCPAYAAARRT